MVAHLPMVIHAVCYAEYDQKPAKALLALNIQEHKQRKLF